MLILGMFSKCNGEISVLRGSHRNRWTACGTQASSLHPTPEWGLPTIRGPTLGVPKIRERLWSKIETRQGCASKRWPCGRLVFLHGGVWGCV